MQIGMLLFPNLTQLDLTGPHEVLARLPGAKVHLVARTAEPVASETQLVIVPSTTFAQLPRVDLLFVPGGGADGLEAMLADEDWRAFLRDKAAQARYVASVCTGGLLLAAAGLLDGLRATTHHDFFDAFEKRFPKVRLDRGARFVQGAPNVFSAGGLTSGVDLALHIVGLYFGPEAAANTARYMEHHPTN
jgi:cyclohexyl-isocyanide hydratase